MNDLTCRMVSDSSWWIVGLQSSTIPGICPQPSIWTRTWWDDKYGSCPCKKKSHVPIIQVVMQTWKLTESVALKWRDEYLFLLHRCSRTPPSLLFLWSLSWRHRSSLWSRAPLPVESTCASWEAGERRRTCIWTWCWHISCRCVKAAWQEGTGVAALSLLIESFSFAEKQRICQHRQRRLHGWVAALSLVEGLFSTALDTLN